MIKEKWAYAIEQMHEVLLGCPELRGVEIESPESKPEKLERFFRELLAERENL